MLQHRYRGGFTLVEQGGAQGLLLMAAGGCISPHTLLGELDL